MSALPARKLENSSDSGQASAMPPRVPQLAQTSGPLTPEDLALVREARNTSRKVTRASRVAAFSGWTTAPFGLLSLVFSIGDVAGMALGAGLLICGIIELRGGRLIRDFDVRAPRILAFNQLTLGLMLVAFALWRLFESSSGPGISSQLQTGDPAMDQMVTSLYQQINSLVYVTIAIVGLVVPGLTALYYFTRTRHIRWFLSATPAWVVDLLRAKA